MKSIQNAFIFIISFFAILLNSFCNSKQQIETSIDQLEHINQELIKRGVLFEQGFRLNIKEIKRIRFDTRGMGFIESLANIKLYNNNFYIVDHANKGINIYDFNGNYKKTLNLVPAPKNGCSYTELLQTTRNTFLLKNFRQSEIIEFDSTGTIIKKYIEDDEKVEIAPVGLDFLETKKGLQIYSGIFQWFQKLDDVLIKKLLVGKFDENGQLVDKFIKHDPIYAKYNLLRFQPCYFKILDNKLYLVEQALPYVRVFSLDGKQLFRFGSPGFHMLPLEKEPGGQMSSKKLNRYYSNHTAYENIFVLNGIKGYPKTSIAIFYYNPDYIDDNERETKCYLIFYTAEGELLYNDFEVPGPVHQVTENSSLLILLDENSSNLTVALYELELTRAF